MWVGGEDITPKYLGGDIVLLMRLTDTRAKEICRESAVNGMTLFYSLEKRHPSMRIGYRLVWIHYWGIPHAWKKKILRRLCPR